MQTLLRFTKLDLFVPVITWKYCPKNYRDCPDFNDCNECGLLKKN